MRRTGALLKALAVLVFPILVSEGLLPSRGHGGRLRGSNQPRLVGCWARAIRLKGGGPPETESGNMPYYLEEELIDPIMGLYESLDRKKYPPMAPVYDDEGNMVIPEPLPLNQFGKVKRLLDENGRLMTSREALRRGVSRFQKKPKGKNSLRLRCTCGNRIPCYGDVMITKNEQGKLEYHKIPRSDIGPAHEWETKQPAQYCVTPTNVNMTELYGGCSPLMLKHLSVLQGMTLDEAERLSDPAMRNESLRIFCQMCECEQHRTHECPFLEDDASDDTVFEWKVERELLTDGLANASATWTSDERKAMMKRLDELDLRIDYMKLYAPIEITKGNKTVKYNQPGVNWGEGQCSFRDVVEANEKLDTPPNTVDIRVPGDYETVRDAVRCSRDGQRVCCEPGQRIWYGRANVEANSLIYQREIQVQSVSERPRERVVHLVESIGGEDMDDNITLRVEMGTPTMLYGMWLLEFGAYGRFDNVSCYSRTGGVPGVHGNLEMRGFEEEPHEIARRNRPKVYTDVCFTVLGGPWVWEGCDVLVFDMNCFTLGNEATIALHMCVVGGTGETVLQQDGTAEPTEAWGAAHVAFEIEGESDVNLTDTRVQLARVAGLRMKDESIAHLVRCTLDQLGVMGGCAVQIKGEAQAYLQYCNITNPKSISPLFQETAAFQAHVSSAPRGALSLRHSAITGHVWMDHHRPCHAYRENVTVYPMPNISFGAPPVSGYDQAIAEGMPDPVNIWGDSRYEIWWPRSRLKRLGFEEVDVHVDGTGQYRHIDSEDVDPNSFSEDGKVAINSSKNIFLQDWGWQGTLEDAYDTEPMPGVEEGWRWRPREDIITEVEKAEETGLRRGRRTQAAERAELARHELAVVNQTLARKHRIEAATRISELAPRGDVSAAYWLKRCISTDKDPQVRAAASKALSALIVRDDEVEDLQRQLANVTIDSIGEAPDQVVTFGGVELLVDALPRSVKSALFPHWPHYPQDPLDQQHMRPPSNKSKTEFPIVQDDKSLDMDDPAARRKLLYHEKLMLAEAGLADYPDEREMYWEVDNRTVDDWFRVMSDKKHEHLTVPMLREYARKFRVELPPEIKELRMKRIRLQKIHELTVDYAVALNISSGLHLDIEDWEELYPMFDAGQLHNPPRPEKLWRIAKRVATLGARLSRVRDKERFALMELLYPLCKRVEAAFRGKNETEIQNLVVQTGVPYTTFGKIADGLLKAPFTISDDGYLMRFNTPEADATEDEEDQKNIDEHIEGDQSSKESEEAEKRQATLRPTDKLKPPKQVLGVSKGRREITFSSEEWSKTDSDDVRNDVRTEVNQMMDDD